MTDDLTTRLRRGFSATDLDAADRIEALEADHRFPLDRLREVEAALAARDAVIAEALAKLNDWATNSGGLQSVRNAQAILSGLRVPQGATEPKFVELARPIGSAEPSTFDLQVAAGVEPSVPAAGPWADPLPWLCVDSLQRPWARLRTQENPDGATYHMVFRPRTRAQYDAEEGNRG